MRVPFAASSVSVARQRLKTGWSSTAVTRTRIEDARVVISELVANSVRHAQPLSDGNILVTWALERRGVRLSVTDGGSRHPAPQASTPPRPRSPAAAWPSSSRSPRLVGRADAGSQSTVHALLRRAVELTPRLGQ